MKKSVIVSSLLVILLIGFVGTFIHYKNKFLNAPPNQLTLESLGQPFKYQWQGKNINGAYEPHVAMFVPVTLPGVEQTFYMQFDMGAHSTVLYYDTVKSINQKYGNIFDVVINEDKSAYIDNVQLKVGSVNLKANYLKFRGRGSKIDWNAPPDFIKIGTIGSDFMEKHVLKMDFKNQLITLSQSTNEIKTDKGEFSPFSFDGRKIFLSATLDEQPFNLWFDSGSSAFELIVEEDTFNQLAVPTATKSTYIGKSWGQDIKIHNIKANGEFRFGKTKVPLTYISHFEWPNKMQILIMKLGNLGGELGGMTGNKLFLGKTLILDTPNLRYAVIEE